jgi:hypothetical protein
MCPSGYLTPRADLKLCVTHYQDAPASRFAEGTKCDAGETLERDRYCTGATNMSSADLNSANPSQSGAQAQTASGVVEEGVK